MASGEFVTFIDSDDYIEKDSIDHKITWIVPNSQKNEMEPIMLELGPKATTSVDMPHEGQEFGYIIEGELDAREDGEELFEFFEKISIK